MAAANSPAETRQRLAGTVLGVQQMSETPNAEDSQDYEIQLSIQRAAVDSAGRDWRRDGLGSVIATPEPALPDRC
jgi:hypothetical protein